MRQRKLSVVLGLLSISCLLLALSACGGGANSNALSGGGGGAPLPPAPPNAKAHSVYAPAPTCAPPTANGVSAKRVIAEPPGIQTLPFGGASSRPALAAMYLMASDLPLSKSQAAVSNWASGAAGFAAKEIAKVSMSATDRSKADKRERDEAVLLFI